MTRDEFIEKYSGKHYGDAKSLENKMAELAGQVFDIDASISASILLVDNVTDLEAAVAAQENKQIIGVLPGTYTLTESLSIPLAASGGVLKAFGQVNIVGAVGADEAILINPAAASGTFEYTLEGFDSIKGGADKIGLHILNTTIGKKVNVYLKQCNLHDNGSGVALKAVNSDGSNAIRIYADGGQMSEIDTINYTPKDNGDRVVFRDYNIDENIVVADVECTATFMFINCKLPHGGVTGGHASNVISVVSCWTEATPFMPVIPDGNDFPGAFSPTIYPASE
jgi:hypothetical protein